MSFKRIFLGFQTRLILRNYRTKIESLIGSTLVFELNFVSDEVAEFTLTIMKDGHPPRVEKGVFDVVDGEIDLDLDDFPEELFLPDEDPQAAGADMSGTEVAAAVTPGQITGDDVQPFLASSTADYEPGDWLEPKDGGDQRMMVVGGSGSPASAKILSEHDSPVLKSQFTAFPQASHIMALPRHQKSEPGLQFHPDPTVCRVYAERSGYTETRCEVLFTSPKQLKRLLNGASGIVC